MNRKHTFIFIPVAVILAFCLFYEISLRPLIIEAYQGSAPQWFTDIVNFLYPRFEIEKERFDLAFFLKRADQVLYRFTFVSIISSIIIYLIRTADTCRTRFSNFWNIETSRQNVKVLRILFYLSLIYIFHDAYTDLLLLHHAKAFYKPVALLRLLHIGYPSATQSMFICLGYIGSCILVILNIFPIQFSILSAGLLILIQGLFFSFEKIDHGFAPLTYAALIFPFLIYESKKTTTEKINGWPLKLITVCIALVYLMSASEKLLLSGFKGISAESFRFFLYLHDTPIGLVVAKSSLLCSLLPVMALLFQATFVLILFLPKLKPIILSIGIFFHLLVYVLFNIGAVVHPWVLSYLFFVDWTFAVKATRKLNINFFR